MLLLRVRALETPQLIPEAASYRGCRAWIELTDDVDALEATTPVLDEATFAQRRAAIRDALAVSS